MASGLQKAAGNYTVRDWDCSLGAFCEGALKRNTDFSGEIRLRSEGTEKKILNAVIPKRTY